MSANLVVDLGNTTLQYPMAFAGPGFTASGAIIGIPVDMIHANTFTSLMISAKSTTNSGQLRVIVQTQDTDPATGTWLDPTSGLAQMPTVFESGGVVRLNSGGGTVVDAAPAAFVQGGTFGAVVSGQCLFSGCLVFAGFQRPHRYARALALSGDFFTGQLSFAFVAQAKTTGSGGGFTYSPGSGLVNV